MKSQRNQIIILVALIIIWAVSWHMTMNRNKPPPPPPPTQAVRVAAQDSLLKIRFRKVRSEMDSLYHYRIKPAPFDLSLIHIFSRASVRHVMTSARERLSLASNWHVDCRLVACLLYTSRCV